MTSPYSHDVTSLPRRHRTRHLSASNRPVQSHSPHMTSPPVLCHLPLNPLTPLCMSKAIASKVGFLQMSPVVTLGFSVVVVVGMVPVPGSGASVLVVVLRGLGFGFGPPAPGRICVHVNRGAYVNILVKGLSNI